MVQAPPRPIESQIDIELEDLHELARINPVAWEQLLHIADNRQNQARIEDLEEHLAQAHETVKVVCPHHGETGCPTLAEHRVVTKAELDAKMNCQKIDIAA